MQSSASVLCDYLRSDLTRSVGSFRDQAPGFTVCCHDGITEVNPTGREFAATQLELSIVKKFQDEIDQEAADKAAFDLFIEMNERCCAIGGNFGENFDLFDEVLGTFRHELWMFFNPEGFPLLNAADIEQHVDFGPGSAPGAGNTSFLEKIGHSTLTAPNDQLVQWYEAVVAGNPLMLDCELTRAIRKGPPVVLRSVEISPVPKTTKISRLVKPEPLIGMFFQKGIQRVLEERLRTFYGIDLTSQPEINAAMAKQGSLDSSFATLDLKSASDCLSLGLCRRFIDSQNLRWLELTRSTHVILRGDGDEGEVAYLNMMATMGNAFCFPLQTIVFAALVNAVYKCLGLTRTSATIRERYPVSTIRSRKGNTGRDIDFKLHRHLVDLGVVKPQVDVTLPTWSVFGDDIIVLHDAYDAVVSNLEKLGFIPNKEKSFNSGGFRESCGHDYFYGYEVRGVYCKSLLKPQDWYVLINTLTDWSAQHGILLGETIAWAQSNVKRIEVPPWENPDAGIRVPLAAVRTPAVYRSRPIKAELPLKENPVTNYIGSYLYKRWCPMGEEYDDDPVTGARTRSYSSIEVSGEGRAKHFGYFNSTALLLAAIKGTLRGGCVSYRSFDAAYGKRVGVAPCWDHIHAGDKRLLFESSWYRTAGILLG